MQNYKVTLKFMYSDVVHVKAESKKDAERLALQDCHEEYECFYNSEIEEEESFDMQDYIDDCGDGEANRKT